MASAAILRSATERFSIQKPQSGWIQATRPGPSTLFGALQSGGDLFGRFDVIDLHVHHADAQADARVDVPQRFQIGGGAVRHLQHQVIDVQLVEEIGERAPLALLDGLAAVVAEAEVDGARSGEGSRARD